VIGTDNGEEEGVDVEGAASPWPSVTGTEDDEE